MVGGGGGGVLNLGTLEIRNSTISYNSTRFKQGGYGGGISNGGSLTVTNSTVSGNSCDGNGGGISNGGPMTITNSTIRGNSADGSGGGISAGGAVEIGNTILMLGAHGANISGNPGTVTSHGYNLSNDNGGGFLTATGDQINTNPMLGPLLNHGGPTFTHALLEGSPAINAGDPSFSPPPVYDQRGPGYDRVVGGRIDVGAFEVQVVGSAPGGH
jgi:hypothetical protein